MTGTTTLRIDKLPEPGGEVEVEIRMLRGVKKAMGGIDDTWQPV